MLFRGLTYLLISASVLFSQTTTIPGDLRVKKHARIDSLANDSTMMVVADTLGRLTVLPIPGGSSNVPGNPTGVVGLSAVNGSNTTYMRSDAAPALSQAIRPAWTDLHTFSDSVTFGSVITTPLTASRLLTVNASSQLAVNAALTANGFLYGTASGGIGSTSAAGNGQILIGSAGVAPVLGTLSGTTNQISISQGAGTLGISIPNILAVPDSLNVGSLTGVGIRMVVAGADGGILTQEIPSGVSPANPSATIGLSAANGSATTYLRSDGAPALSQAIIPTWTGIHTWSDSVRFNDHVRVTSPDALLIPLIVRAASGQSALLSVWQNNGGGTLASISETGAITGGGYSGGPISGSTGSFSSTLGVTNLITATGGIEFAGGTSAAGRIIRSGTSGLVIRGVTGSSYDMVLTNPGGSDIMYNPTGTIGVQFLGGITASGGVSVPDGQGLTSEISATTRDMITRSGTTLTIGENGGWANTVFNLPTSGEWIWSQGATTRLYVNSVGRTIVNSASDHGETFQVDGTAYISGAVTMSTLAGTGTRMVVADASGVISTQSIPEAGSLANPTATIGLTAVNGSATSGMRSDGAPALSQAIVPTWTGAHNFTAGLLADSVVIAGAGSGVADSQFVVIAADADSRFTIGNNTSNSLELALTRSDGATVMSVNGHSLETIFGTLAGSGTRMVVADASGVLSTQSIPEAGSLANPTATIGLTAVNGSATSGMRSDGAPALSQAIVPTWTGAHTFDQTTTLRDLRFNPAVGSNGALFRMLPLTSNGNDTAQVILCGGSTNDATRGACLALNGNEASAGGGATLTLGDGASGFFQVSSSLGGGSVYFGDTYSSHTWGMHATGDVLIEDSLRVSGNVSLGSDVSIADSLSVAGSLRHEATVKVVSTVSSSTSIEIPLFTTDLITITLAHDATITVQDGAATGRHFTLRVKQDGTGGRDITWGSEFEFPGGVEPTQTTAANTWSYYSFMYNEVENTWDFVGNALDFGGS